MCAFNADSNKAQLESQLSALQSERDQYALQLGNEMFLAAQGNPSLKIGHEPLFASMESCDYRIGGIQQQIAQLSAPVMPTQAGGTCPSCGSPLKPGDAFCGTCGTKVTAPASPAPASICHNCGQPVEPGSVFCMNCGTRLDTKPVVMSTPQPSENIEQELVAAGQPVVTQPAAEPQIDPNVCPHCGFQMGENDLFCMGCGAKREPKAAPAPVEQPVVIAMPAPEPEPAISPEPEPVIVDAPADPAPVEPEPEAMPELATTPAPTVVPADEPEPNPEPEAEAEVEAESEQEQEAEDAPFSFNTLQAADIDRDQDFAPVSNCTPIFNPDADYDLSVPKPQDDASEFACKNCGFVMKEGDLFCPMCGNRA